jgi:hypothetical protein
MNVRQLAGRSIALVGVGTLCLAAGGIGIAAATNGASLVLGASNAATHTTTLKDPAGTPLSLLAKKGTPPLAVNSRKLVKNLNAFEVGGLSASQLKTTGSAAQLTTDLNSGSPSTVVLPVLTSSTPPFVLRPVTIVSTAKLAAGSYLVTGSATGSQAACWVGTIAAPGSAHQIGLAQEGSAVVTQLVKVQQGQKINLYCSDISTSSTGTLISAGITALHVSSVSVGTAGT